MEVGAFNALGGKSVEMGGFYRRATETRKVGVAHVVSEQQNDVRPGSIGGESDVGGEQGCDKQQDTERHGGEGCF